jgi:hypothetical protein
VLGAFLQFSHGCNFNCVINMQNFEFKAPMYVNFVQSSGLEENDDADKFFGKNKC